MICIVFKPGHFESTQEAWTSSPTNRSDMATKRSAPTDARCRFCRRWRADVRWRRAQGRECYACPSLIKCDSTILEEMGPTKDDLDTALENDRDKHAKFMGKLSDWEEKRAQGSNSRGKASVESFNSDSIECRKNWVLVVGSSLHSNQKAAPHRRQAYYSKY